MILLHHFYMLSFLLTSVKIHLMKNRTLSIVRFVIVDTRRFYHDNLFIFTYRCKIFLVYLYLVYRPLQTKESFSSRNCLCHYMSGSIKEERKFNKINIDDRHTLNFFRNNPHTFIIRRETLIQLINI